MKLTDEMVEDGAKAIARAWEGPRGWDDMAEAERDILRRDARAALEAALTEDDTEWEYGFRGDFGDGHERVILDAIARALGGVSGGERVRRRPAIPAGPWEPVPTEGGDER